MLYLEVIFLYRYSIGMKQFYSKDLTEPAEVIMRDVCGVKENERVLIITNPEENVLQISMALYDAAKKQGGTPVLEIQDEKTLLDYADKSVNMALKSEPDVICSISSNKLGKDEEGMKTPYVINGEEFTSIFNYLLDGKKCSRGIWTPGITLDMFKRTACIDYALLDSRCKKLSEKYRGAVSVHVTAPAGTDIEVPIEGRQCFSDDGQFVTPGTGGNIPAGEVFISPLVGKSEGKIVFDGSMSLTGGDIKITEPIICDVKAGFVTDIYNSKGSAEFIEETECLQLIKTEGAAAGKEASLLYTSVTMAERKASQAFTDGLFSREKADQYAKNARNIGELGIGLNPSAIIAGNMLEDEKAFRTCHFAIGLNYDNDAPSFIHLDGVVRNPTIVIKYADGSTFTVEKDGELNPELS